MRRSHLVQIMLFTILTSLAQAAYAFDVLSNIDGLGRGSSCGNDLAVGFTTGPGGPYSIRSVAVRYQDWPSSIEVSIFDDDAGLPSTLVGSIGTLDVPGSDGTFINSTIRAESTILLEGDTDYWLVVDGESFYCFLGLTSDNPSDDWLATNFLRKYSEDVGWVAGFLWAMIELDIFPSVAVDCNDGGVSACGFDIEVRCEGADEDLFLGSLELIGQWDGEYGFGYDAGDDGADPADFVCGGEFDAATLKYETKCTNVLKGNGKNSDEITVDIDVKYDESLDDC